MSKYDALTSALAERPEAEVVLTFDEIDNIVVGGLPPSARTYSEWWANRASSQPHSAAWLKAGRLAYPDFDAGTARFALDRDEALSRLGASPPKAQTRTAVTAFWVTVGGHAPENLDVGLEKGLWGTFEGYENRVARVAPGDLVVFYERNRGLILVRATGRAFQDTTPIWEDYEHPNRVPISPVLAEAEVEFSDIYNCLRDQQGAVFGSVNAASASIRGRNGVFRSLSEPEVTDLFARLGWSSDLLTRPTRLRSAFERAVEAYLPSKEGAFASSSPAWQAFEQLRNELSEAAPVSRRAQLEVEWSVGRGNWAHVPWVTIRDPAQSSSVQDGLYLVYLFRADMSGFYLVLGQGVTEPLRAGMSEGRELLRARAEEVASGLSGVGESGFELLSQTDLRVSSGVGRNYELGAVVSKFYSTDRMPDDPVLLDDLDALLNAYLDRRHARRTWIFQSSPKVFDAPSAVAALDTLNWSVRQHVDQIREGDTAYVWESGSDAGIIAKATLTESPRLQSSDRGSHPYIRDDAALEDDELRVFMQVDQAFPDRRITRQVLRESPELEGLAILRQPAGTNFPVTPEEAEAIEALIPTDHEQSVMSVKGDMATLVAETLWEEDDLRELVDALETTSPQVVLAGPPGTGKTWVARHLARYLVDSDRMHRTVQLHPSFGYEEFIEGLRPVATDGGIAFEVRPGVVLQMSQGMSASDRKVLIIDEMNRANLPRVFGELMYLFEYRGEPISLQYTAEYQMPAGLKFVGTMNTADRSIRSIDIALRRRFDVFECLPDPDILRRFYENPGNANEVDGLVEGMVALNERLEADLDRHHTIGQTFFMSERMTPDRLRAVWERKLKPLIEEYFFDEPDVYQRYQLTDFWPSASAD